MECYANFKKMRPLSRNQISRLRVGDKILYVNDSDELNTVQFDDNGRRHSCRVVYEAEVIQSTDYLLALSCMPIIGTIHGWPIGRNIKPHVESISKSEGCAASQQWLFKNIEWEFV